MGVVRNCCGDRRTRLRVAYTSRLINLNPGLSESLYTQDMTQKIDQKGQVVVPKSIRDALSIGPGDEVVVSLSDGGALIQLVNTATSLKGTFAGSNMLEMLEQERAHEQKRATARTVGQSSQACQSSSKNTTRCTTSNNGCTQPNIN